MKNYCLFLFFLVSFVGFSQQEDAWVYFTDKPDFQSYYDAPLTMLSQRALGRRTNQNISLDIKDVPIQQSYIDEIGASNGIEVKAKSKWMNALHIQGSEADINQLTLLSFVEKIDFADRTINQTERKARKSKNFNPDKTEKEQVDFAYGNSSNQINMLNGQFLHQQNHTGLGKIIAVLDGGFPGVNTAVTFKRLRDNNQILGGYDYVMRNANFYSGDNHGTFVLSAMGGYQVDQLVGTAPDASYYLFITEEGPLESPIEESNWVEAAEAADSLGVDIITTSLGYFGDHTNPAHDYKYEDMDGKTTFISRGAEIAFSRGMIVVASAGNSGGQTEPHIGAPADAKSVITVGAVTAQKGLASFSSIGPSYDDRVKPEVMAQGQQPVLSDENGNITTNNGTSFSCPIMAGMIACLWQAYPNKTNQEIRDLVIRSGDRFSTPTPTFGYGIPNFSSALNNGLGVNQFSKNNAVVYPNPASDTVSIALPNELDKGMIIFYSLLGQKTLEINLTKQTDAISLKSLNKGIYLYKIESDTYSRTGKLIKQ
jgi:subtilisin family serine protease